MDNNEDEADAATQLRRGCYFVKHVAYLLLTSEPEISAQTQSTKYHYSRPSKTGKS